MDEIDKKLESLMERIDYKEEIDGSLERKIDRLVKECNCTHRQAAAMIEFTGGNVNQAIEIISSRQEKNTIIIKARFRADHTKHYGMIFLALNLEKEMLEKIEVAVASDMRLCQFDESASWENFEKVVYGLQLRDGVIPRLTGILKHRIKEIFRSKSKKMQFVQILKNGNYSLFKDWFRDEIASAVNDNSLDLKVDIDLISTLEPERAVKSLPKEKEEPGIVQKLKKEKREADFVLEVALSISPLSGILVSDLRRGDRVIVKIVDNREVGMYIAKLMGGRKDNKIIPIIAYVEDVIFINEHDVKVIVNLGPGIKGEAIENIEIRAMLVSSNEMENDEKFISSSLYKTLSFILMIFILVLIYIIIFNFEK
ncbi:MAG: hypothetical protein QMD92_03105 [bacterium]|nr:hypothetical protein [bacterium]